MTTQPPSDGTDSNKPGDGINPAMRRDVDAEFTDDQHGSEPMETVSVKQGGPEVWPIIWLGVVLILIIMTIWLLI